MLDSKGLPKSARLLRPREFRQVYDHGTRFSSPLFSAFCLSHPESIGARIGFTTPRGLGKAVVRNRIRRRVREAIRCRVELLSPEWWIVLNPRRKALDCPFAELEWEIDRLVRRYSMPSLQSSVRTKS